MSEITAEYLFKLNQQRLDLIDIVNNVVDNVDKLSDEATLDDVVARLKTIDNYSLLRNYLMPTQVNPNGDWWSVNDIDGKITSLRPYSFYAHTGLGDVCLPNIKTIPTYAFYGCSMIKAKFEKVNTVSPECTFMECSSLESISFPSATTFSIKDTFKNCTALKSITFNKNGICTFSLTGTSTASHYSFATCPVLEAFVFPSKDGIPKFSTYADTDFNRANINAYVPKSMVETYNASWWGTTFKGEVRAIEDYYDFLINLGADLEDYELEISE